MHLPCQIQKMPENTAIAFRSYPDRLKGLRTSVKSTAHLSQIDVTALATEDIDRSAPYKSRRQQRKVGSATRQLRHR